MTEQLTHIDENGDVRMVDVSQKADTERVAVAEGFISMKPETLALIVEGKAAKGDVLACARVAGVMAAKKTSDLIPMCHPLNITKAKVECEPVREGERADGRVGIHVVTTCGVTGKTGIEMEALTAASVACLTVYDMCKAVDRGMEITDVRLLKRTAARRVFGCAKTRRSHAHLFHNGKPPAREGRAGGFVDDLRSREGSGPQRKGYRDD